MKNHKKVGYIVSIIFLLMSLITLFVAFSQIPALNKAYNLKNNGRNVQATIDDFHTVWSENVRTGYVLHYSYEENGKSWVGIIEYHHKNNESPDIDSWINYYEAMIGDKVDITIDPNSEYCQLTEEVESLYQKTLTNEILRFSFGGGGLLFTVVFFTVFLIVTKKDDKPEKCAFIQGKKE